MNWEAIGAVGEVFGALGVIATLGYLAIQIRQNTRATSASALNLALHDINELTNHNERYVELLFKVARGESLSDEESVHMVERFISLMRTYENFWYQFQLKNLTAEQFEHHADTIRWTLSTRVSRDLWRTLKSSFEPGFQEYVDAEVVSREAPSSLMLKAFNQLQQPNSEPVQTNASRG